MIQNLILRVKRRETPFARLAYRVAKRARTFEMPAPRAIFLPVWYAHHAIVNGWRWITRAFYFQPMFRDRCERVGKNLHVDLGAPYVYGDIRIRIGDNVRMSAVSSFVSTSAGQAPLLEIGSDTYLGGRFVVSVGSRVSIGSHVLISDSVVISDNPGHPLDAMKRRTQGVDRDQIKPITIGDDVWIGRDCKIMPGVTIGEGSVIGTGSVVTKDIPPYSLAIGTPAKVVRDLRPAVPSIVAAA